MISHKLIKGLSREEYEDIEALRFTRLKRMLQSPAHYRAGLDEEHEDTDAQALGTAVHSLSLEPNKLNVALWDGGRRFGKEWDAFCKANKGKTILKPESMAKARAMADAVLSKPRAAELLKHGDPEVTLLWEHMGLQIKGRADWIGAAIVDLKTTRNAEINAFGKDCAQRRYHMQAAMYSHGLFLATGKMLPVYIVAVESAEPFDVVVYKLPTSALDAGKKLYETSLRRLSQCMELNRWPGTDNGADYVELSLPTWAIDEATFGLEAV